MVIDTAIKKGYNQTDLSVIPEGWEMQSLEGISDPKLPICYGIVQVGSFVSNGIPVLAIKNLNTDYSTNVHRSSPTIEALYARSRVLPGDVLISVKGTIGRIGIVPQYFVGNISRDIARLRLTKRDVPEFWFQMLQSESAQRRLGLAMVGTTRMELSIGILKQIRMLRPPKVEQSAIATALSDVDALITSLDKLIAKKRDIKQATMLQLLTGKIRLPEFRNKIKSTYKQANVETIPEDWDILPLGELTVTIASGMSKTKSTHGTYPVYGSTGIISYTEFAEYEGDALLVARVGANAGKLTYVTGKYGVTDNAIIIRLKSKLWLPFFWKQLEIKQLNSLVFGSGQPLITGTQLKKLLMYVPSNDEQRAIATILTGMDAEIAALQLKREKTRALKLGMMQELLTGKTRLK